MAKTVIRKKKSPVSKIGKKINKTTVGPRKAGALSVGEDEYYKKRGQAGRRPRKSSTKKNTPM